MTRKTLKQAYQEILYSTVFSPGYYLHTTYAQSRMPSRYSVFPHQDIDKLLHQVKQRLGIHLVCFGGTGERHHFHGVICTPKSHEPTEHNAKLINNFWTHGLSKTSVFNHDIIGAGKYTLECHEVFDASLNRVYCPKIHHDCKTRGGCIFKKKKGLLNKLTGS